jgi:hypothetical protein
MGVGEVQVRFPSSICCKIEETENIKRCARTRGGAWTRKGRRYLAVAAESKGIWRRQWRNPTMKFAGLAACFREKREGK